MFKKQSLVCLLFIIFIIGVFSGCSTVNPRSTSESASALQSAIDRFEQAKGLSCSELPELYDISRLKAGSSVRLKLMYDKSKKPYFETQTLREIKPTNTEKRYIIDMVIGNSNYSLEGGPFAFNRVICSDEASIINYSKAGRDNIPTSVIKGAIMGGIGGGIIGSLAGIPLSLIEYSQTQTREEGLRQGLQDRKIETKIIDFKFISQETLMISSRAIPCRVYEIQMITRQIIPPMNHVGASTWITEETKKVWISDEVPFGLVKSKGNKILHMEILGIRPIDMTQNMTENCEVTEFNY